MKYLSQIASVDAATGSHIFDREKEVVKKQLEMLKFRKEFPAFGFDAEMEIRTKPAAQI